MGSDLVAAMARFPRPRHRLLSLSAGLALLLPCLGLIPGDARAASALLETVKQNPELARTLCGQFKAINAEGRSALSRESVARVASSQGLSQKDAEVLTTYVIGLHCPDVR
jgi:hypothetical protein